MLHPFIDNFLREKNKQINDSYGHQFGDKVPVHIANTIKLVLRKGDYVARIGGEEFVVLLKETSEAQAKFVAKKIRANVQRLQLEHDDNEFNCTVSIGIAASHGATYTFDVLFNQADKALYQAKPYGRNRCRLYQ
jgi:diguanylate cyclase (GGDEF)-like protein